MYTDQWNETYPIGTEVLYFPIMGHMHEVLRTKTRSEAWQLGDGTGKVKVDGRAGGVALHHVTPLPEPGESIGI